MNRKKSMKGEWNSSYGKYIKERKRKFWRPIIRSSYNWLHYLGKINRWG